MRLMPLQKRLIEIPGSFIMCRTLEKKKVGVGVEPSMNQEAGPVCVRTQLCPTLCNPTRDCSLPGSSLQRIFQAQVMEWVATGSSRGIFPTQGSNPHLLRLLHWQVGSLPRRHLGRPRSGPYWIPKSAGSLILDIPVSRTVRNTCLLFITTQSRVLLY